MENSNKEQSFTTFLEDKIENTTVIKGGPETDRGTVTTPATSNQ
jgi:hypothetical protein